MNESSRKRKNESRPRVLFTESTRAVNFFLITYYLNKHLNENAKGKKKKFLYSNIERHFLLPAAATTINPSSLIF